MQDAIHAVEEAFGQFALGNVRVGARVSVTTENHGGLMLTMPAYIVGTDAMGQKVVTVYPANPSRHQLPTVLATVQLFNPETGECLALMDGTFLTAMRTGAASGVATKYLSRADSKCVAIFGAGAQAETQLEAVTEVRTIGLAKVFDPLTERKLEFCDRMSRKLRIAVRPSKESKENIADSDIVICATTSHTPVFSGEWLEPGMHINAIGSFDAGSREIDTTTVKRSKVVVDSREAAMKEAGDLLIPIAENVLSPEHIFAELGEIVIGRKAGRTTEQEITLFKSVGLAIQDVSVALTVYKKALELHKGTVARI